MQQAFLVGVIGAADADAELRERAREVGAEIARRGWWLICGGLGGVMEAACRGAREAGGHTIGVLPGTNREEANAWVETALVTGLSEARNVVIARSACACIAIGGGYGTLSELAFCLKFGTPVVLYDCPWGEALQDRDVPSASSATAACNAVQVMIQAR